MRLSSGYERRRARVKMLPLIDIVFLLLVFFIYAMLSMVVHRGLRVELPTASTAQTDQREYISITLTEDNTVYLNKAQVTLNILVDSILEHMGRDKDIPVFINGDTRSDLGTAIQVLDLLRGAGIKEVRFEVSAQNIEEF